MRAFLAAVRLYVMLASTSRCRDNAVLKEYLKSRKKGRDKRAPNIHTEMKYYDEPGRGKKVKSVRCSFCCYTSFLICGICCSGGMFDFVIIISLFFRNNKSNLYFRAYDTLDQVEVQNWFI